MKRIRTHDCGRFGPEWTPLPAGPYYHVGVNRWWHWQQIPWYIRLIWWLRLVRSPRSRMTPPMIKFRRIIVPKIKGGWSTLDLREIIAGPPYMIDQPMQPWDK